MTVLLTVAATGALTMPAAYHRIRFRQGDKERMLRISNVFAIAGLVLLTFAMACVVFLITNVIYGLAAALPVALDRPRPPRVFLVRRPIDSRRATRTTEA